MNSRSPSSMRIGLVLGAGGPVGHAFHAGVLSGLSKVLGWDAGQSELVVGTSAGAQVGALLRAGMTAHDLCARLTGDAMTPEGDAIAQHYTRPRRDTPRAEPRPYAPAAPHYVRQAMRRPWSLRPGRVVAALLPAGRVRLDAQAHGFRRIFGDAWPRQKLWITAVELGSGRSVAFGRPGSPATDVGTAVTCSGAVPSVCEPVRVGNHHFVDGGIASATHLDLLHDAPLDVVLVSSPLSMLAPMRLLLRAELRRLARRGIPSIVFEPFGPSARAMGLNPMDLRRSGAVARAAFQATLAELRPRAEKRRKLERFL